MVCIFVLWNVPELNHFNLGARGGEVPILSQPLHKLPSLSKAWLGSNSQESVHQDPPT